ncbi:4Fe-4S binding protein [Clostridium sp. PL3]|uniref:4Fe-4S binding protein n=1 Tax=Clostridium thailandense TaxID=2794346 RepID=A0A949U139_9CLOT|nr:4Fe-4S binding protein [Clostridium thailandense]MBV7274349.1 4Fe-4S binding protein [Clostridium thailandense]
MKVSVKSERCKQCMLCFANCPKEAISYSEEFNSLGYRWAQIDDNKCIACGICYTMCPDGVFEILGKEE